jgi:hypothetical protein
VLWLIRLGRIDARRRLRPTRTRLQVIACAGSGRLPRGDPLRRPDRRASLRAEISGPMPDRNARAAHAGVGIAAGRGRPLGIRADQRGHSEGRRAIIGRKAHRAVTLTNALAHHIGKRVRRTGDGVMTLRHVAGWRLSEIRMTLDWKPVAPPGSGGLESAAWGPVAATR